MPKRNAVGEVHHLINEERRKRGLPHVYWSKEMYRLAKDQSNKMAKAGFLFHSNRYALQGGENICGGKGYHSAKDFVRNWMGSPRHRAWILDPRVKTAGVGISRSRHGTFAAWAFSDQPLYQPVKIKAFRFKMPFKLRWSPFKHRKAKGGEGMLRLPVKVILMSASIASIILGAHGLYVYFSRLEALFGGKLDKLFLILELPVSELQSVVEWMSVKGLQSWFIPAVFVVMGIIIWSWSQRISGGSNILKKLHLW